MTFVGDYAQFDFNGPRLSTFVWPRVEVDAREWTFGDSGYRDALCALIGRTLTSVVDVPGTGVVLRFDADALVINPEPEELQGPEIAMLHMNDDDHAWDIWRPGEGSFSGRDW